MDAADGQTASGGSGVWRRQRTWVIFLLLLATVLAAALWICVLFSRFGSSLGIWATGDMQGVEAEVIDASVDSDEYQRQLEKDQGVEPAPD